jgi:hypothetical protein
MAVPVDVDPYEWEQLGGYLMRVARFLRCEIRMLCSHVGLPAQKAAALAGAAAELLPDVEAVVAKRLGRDPAEIRSMTFAVFETGLFKGAELGCAGTQVDAPSLLTGGPYCLACVLEGRWDLRWKTGLTAVCSRHHTYLVARCGQCGTPICPDLMTAPVDLHRGAVQHGPNDESSCRFDLTRAAEGASIVHLHTQTRLNRYLDAARHDTTAASACRDVLRWAEYLHRGRSDRPLITGRSINSDGPALADLLGDALALAVDTAVTAVIPPVLERAVSRQVLRGKKLSLPPRYAPFDRAEPDRVLALHATIKAMLAVRAAAPMPGFRGRIDLMPQVLPGSVFVPDVSDLLDDIGYDRARAVAAVSASAHAGERSWNSVARRLDLPVGVGQFAGRVLAQLERTGADGAYWAAIDTARRQLEATGINFRDRARLLLHGTAVLDCAIGTWPALAALPTDVVRQWLLERWACQYIATLPGGLDGHRSGNMPDLRDQVDALLAGQVDPATFWRTWNPQGGADRAAG